MDEKNNSDFTPLLPFDSSMRDHIRMYDSPNYVCNRDACHGKIQMNSDNVIKYYSCKMEEEVLKIEQEENKI